MSDLLPCPFCGSEPELIRFSADGRKYTSIRCRNCNIESDGYADENELIEWWNTRYTGKKPNAAFKPFKSWYEFGWTVCPRCGGHSVQVNFWIGVTETEYSAYCPSCGFTSERFKTIDGLVDLLRRKDNE